MNRVSKSVGVGSWALWAVLALFVSGLLADLALYAHRTSIEYELSARSRLALRAAELPGFQVEVNGRDATVREAGADGDTDADDCARAADVVRVVEGVRVSRVSGACARAAAGSQGRDGSASEDPAPPVVDKQAVQAQIDQLVAATPITFQPDSAQLTPQAGATVDRVAALLSIALAVAVQVGGHAAKTPGEPQRAQQLSQRRAEVVAQRLIAQGVSAERVQALGHSDSQALPDLAASRRAEITVR